MPEIDETSPIYSAMCRHLLELSANEMRFAGEVLHAFKVARMRQNPPNQPPFALFSGQNFQLEKDAKKFQQIHVNFGDISVF